MNKVKSILFITLGILLISSNAQATKRARIVVKNPEKFVSISQMLGKKAVACHIDKKGRLTPGVMKERPRKTVWLNLKRRLRKLKRNQRLILNGRRKYRRLKRKIKRFRKACREARKPTGPWTPPIGIPAPGFGIFEKHTMYEGQTYDFGSGPEPYKDAGSGPYTHYVDNTHSDATNSSNTYGTPDKPRLAVPQYLPAGSVVEVHGGPYTRTMLNVWQGTSEKPIFVRGVGKPDGSGFSLYNDNAGWHNGEGGQYVIIEGFGLRGQSIGNSINPPFYNHVTLRNCEIYNPSDDPALSGGIGMGGSSQSPVHNIVIYNNEIHNADTLWDDVSLGDWDRHGIKPHHYASYIWVVDNHIHHNGGNAIQIGDYGENPNLHHIYVGRNVAHHNRQASFGLKSAEDVIFSGNTVHSDRSNESPSSSGMGMQYQPQRVWFLFNHIYNAHWGIHSGSASTENVYVIGNVIHDIRNNVGYNQANPHLASAAIHFRGARRLHVIGNTIYNVDAGIIDVAKTSYLVANNIIANIDNSEESLDSKGVPVWLYNEGGTDSWTLSNNLFYNGSADPYVFRLGGTEYTLGEAANLYPDKSHNNIQADPKFANASANNFSLQAGSPAIDAGTSSGGVKEVFDRFQSLYGIDLRKDAEGKTRTRAWDIGAYEYD